MVICIYLAIDAHSKPFVTTALDCLLLVNIQEAIVDINIVPTTIVRNSPFLFIVRLQMRAVGTLVDLLGVSDCSDIVCYQRFKDVM